VVVREERLGKGRGSGNGSGHNLGVEYVHKLQKFHGSKDFHGGSGGRVLDWKGLHGNLAIGSGIIGSDNQSCLRCAWGSTWR
jgi:hypothetical protein